MTIILVIGKCDLKLLFISGTMSDVEQSDSGGNTVSLHDESSDEEHEAGAVERVFRRFAGLLHGPRAPEISYRSAHKQGAYPFSKVTDCLDAYRWI